jgi:hypothetical protein
MTAQEIAKHIATMPVGTRITVVFEIGDASSSSTSTYVPPSGPTEPSSATASALPPVDPPIKLKAAKARFGIPVRELQRAVQGGFLPAGQKADGKDAGAFLVEPHDVADYEKKRDRVRHGMEAAPTNWPGPKPRS